jgi:MFS family permease
MLFGSLLSSPVDKYRGSRPALIWCSICCFLAYFGSSQAPNFFFLICCQSLVGLTLGIRAPIVYSNLASLFPNEAVSNFSVTVCAFAWVLGSMYASFTGWISLGQYLHQSWRVYLLILTIPSLICLLLAIFFLHEPIHSAFFVQYRLEPVLDLFRLHYGQPMKKKCKYFVLNVLSCGGLMCCKGRFGKKSSSSQLHRYGTMSIDIDAYSINSNKDYTYSGQYVDTIPPYQNVGKKMNGGNGKFGQTERSLGMDRFGTIALGNNDLIDSNQDIEQQQQQQQQQQHHHHQRRPSLFKDEIIFHSEDPNIGSLGNSTFFPHEEFLPVDFQVNLFDNSKNEFFETNNTIYNENMSPPGSLADQGVVLPHTPIQQGIGRMGGSYQPMRTGLGANMIDNYLNPLNSPNNNKNGNNNNNNNNTNDAQTSSRYGQNISNSKTMFNHYDDSTLLVKSIRTDENDENDDQNHRNGQNNRHSPYSSSNLSGYDPTSPEYTTTTTNGHDMIIDWNIDIDNPLNMDEFFDFIAKQWAQFAVRIENEKNNFGEKNMEKYYRNQKNEEKNKNNKNNKNNTNNTNNNIDDKNQYLLRMGEDDQSSSSGQYMTDSNNSFSLNDSNDDSFFINTSFDTHNSVNSINRQNNPNNPNLIQTKLLNKNQQNQQNQQNQIEKPSMIFLILLLSIVWFIVSFATSGFSSFLPTLWKNIIPPDRQDDTDMDYIVSFIYSAIQLPAGFFNMIAVSYIPPRKLLFIGTVIAFVSTSLLAATFSSSTWAAMGFVFCSQFGSSIIWCIIQLVSLVYFDDDKKVFAYAIQASVGKAGSFLAQFAFAHLSQSSPLVLLIVVSILNFIAVVCTAWVSIVVAPVDAEMDRIKNQKEEK